MKNEIIINLEKKLQSILSDFKKKFLISVNHNISSIFINNIIVLHYKKYAKLNTIANIIFHNSRTISIIPFDIYLLPNIEKSLYKFKDLFNIQKDKQKIIISISKLTSEKKIFFIKKIKAESEKIKNLMKHERRKINKKYILNSQFFNIKNNWIQIDKDIQNIYKIYITKVIKMTNIKENEIMLY